ncbi:MAG: twin-arginine translocase subunit TatB [Corynebacterium sp.]|nr:twin-arginine translocase subunit TatB [Corynebacterium sp.]
MFSSIGWPEIFLILLLGLIIIGPDRLPKVIEDLRAAVYAARKAINNAKAELNGEMGEVTKEFEEFRKPINQIASYTTLGPRKAFTKALLDDDDTFLDAFDPKKIMNEKTVGQAHREGGKTPNNEVPNPNPSAPSNQTQQPTNAPHSGTPRTGGNPGTTGSAGVDGTNPGVPPQQRTAYSWEDLI